MLVRQLVALALAAAAGAQAPAPRAAPARYALIPPRNLSGDPVAARALADEIQAELERRGASFVDPASIEAFLRARRIRYTDSIASGDLRVLAEATGATHALVSTLFDHAPVGSPRIALALRALDTANGARAGSSVVALRGEDFEGLLGLGRIDDAGELGREAVGRALATFDEHGAPRALAAPKARGARPRPPDGGHGFALEDFDPASVDRVAVLPLADRSRHTDAAAQFVEFLGDAWFRSGRTQVVEIADLRATMIAHDVRSITFVDFAQLAELGRSLGVRYFVTGSIERYGDLVLVHDERYPEVEATLHLVDAERERIVASAGVRRRGDDYPSILGLGVVRDPIELARRTARELVVALGG